MSSAAAAASSTVWAWRPEGTGTPWRANTCFPWYSRRSIRAWTVVGRARSPSRDRATAWKRRSLPPWHHGPRYGDPQGHHVRHLRRVRNPDRLGDRRLRCVQARGRSRRVHDRARRADPAVLRGPEADPGGLIRAVRRGPAPYRRADRQDARLAARALPRRIPARLGPTLAAVQGDQSGAPEDRQEVQGGLDLEHRRQAPRPDPPAHAARLRPGRDRAAGALLQARSGPLRRMRAADRRQ